MVVQGKMSETVHQRVGLFARLSWFLLLAICYFSSLGSAALHPESTVVLNRSNLDSLEALELVSSLASHYPRSCLRIGVDVDWKDEPHVKLKDDPAGRETLTKFKETLFGVSKMNCIMLFLSKPPSKELLTSLNPRGSTDRFFLVLCDSMEQVTELLFDANLREEENVVAVVRSDDLWKAFTRQLYTQDGKMKIDKAIAWKPGVEKIFNEYLYREQMKNFYGTKFQAATLRFRPFSDYVEKEGTKTVNDAPCLDIYILREMAKRLNFTYEIVMSQDGLWGTRFPNGSWTGVMGDVQFRRSNLSLVLSLTVERTLVADFTRMYYNDPLTFVTAKSRPKPQWQKVFEPFSDTVWAASLISILTAAGLFHVLRQGKLGRHFTVLQTFMDVYGSFFSQGVSGIPVKMSAQVFLGFWFLYAFLVTTYYKSALMAVLAVPTIPPTINTLEELLKSDLAYGMIDAKGSEYQLFSTSDVVLYKTLFKKMTFYSSDESMDRVASGRYGYIYFHANLESIVSTQYTDQSGQSNLHVASEKFFPGGYAWAFPKGAPYRRTFDQVMWRSVQAGLIKKWVKDLNRIYWQERQKKKTEEEIQRERQEQANKQDEELVILNMSHLQGVFIALVYGNSCGVICFFIELVLPRLTGLLCRKTEETGPAPPQTR